jgi:hypothetical protein
MPRIPIYEQQTRVSGAGLGPSAESASAGARGLVALGGALEQVSRNQDRLQAFERQKAEERAAVWAQERLMGVRSKWLEELQRRQREAPENPEGFTPSVLADFDRERDELIEQAPTEGARNWLSERLGAVRLGLQEDALRFEASRAVDYKVSGLMRATDAARTAAEFRPGDFAELAAEQRAAIEASGLPADMQAKLTQESVTSIASAAVQGMIRRDPYATLRALNDENTRELAVRALTFDQRQALRNSAEAEIRQREAEDRARKTELRQMLSDQLADIAAAAQSGIVVTDVPSLASLQDAFGAGEGMQRYESAQRLAQLSGEMAEMHQMTPEEIASLVERYRPKTVEGAAEAAHLYGWVARAASQIMDAREKDPAGYLVQHSPVVRATWQTLQEQSTPEAVEDYLRAVRAERDRLGIANDDLLPQAFAQSLVDQIQSGPAEGIADRIEQEAVRWGAAWPEVYGQVADDLSDIALVIGSGIRKHAATALAATMFLKDSDLKALLPPSTTWNDVQLRVDDEFADFTRSLPPEAARTVNAVKDAAVRLAVKYRSEGHSLSNAVERAYRDLIGSQYEMREFRGVMLRIPATLDADLIESGARSLIEQFTPSPGSILVPPGAVISEEEYTTAFAEYVREHGYWMTRPDALGVRLYVDGAPVNGPVDVTWAQLEEAASAAEAERVRRERIEAAQRMERR